MSLDSQLAVAPEHVKLVRGLQTFLDEHFPRDRQGLIGMTPEWLSTEEFAWYRDFNRALSQAGFLVPHWPAEYGGRDATMLEQLLVREELAYRRVPIANVNGLDMVAPILLGHGTEEQKRRHLPGIAAVDMLWCQGYSEPEAGSDLGSLRTTAIRDGDRYTVNGTKIWTGHGLHADWMMLLARTDPASRGRNGLSLIMLDMKNTPGVTVQPIRSLTGRITFCQEFFTDAEVPAENVVGVENDGWRVSHELLTHERTGVGKTAGMLRVLHDLIQFATTHYRGKVPEGVAARLGAMAAQVDAARALAYDLARQRGDGGMPAAMASVMKLCQSELTVELNALGAEVRGLDPANYATDGTWDPWEEYLASLLHRIGGGTSEIQRDIIASTLVGLPR